MIGADGQENVPHRDWLLTFDRVQNEVKDEMKQLGREGEFIGAKVNLFEWSSFPSLKFVTRLYIRRFASSLLKS